jgi:hypothetical protein
MFKHNKAVVYVNKQMKQSRFFRRNNKVFGRDRIIINKNKKLFSYNWKRFKFINSKNRHLKKKRKEIKFKKLENLSNRKNFKLKLKYFKPKIIAIKKLNKPELKSYFEKWEKSLNFFVSNLNVNDTSRVRKAHLKISREDYTSIANYNNKIIEYIKKRAIHKKKKSIFGSRTNRNYFTNFNCRAINFINFFSTKNKPNFILRWVRAKRFFKTVIKYQQFSGKKLNYKNNFYSFICKLI